MIELAECKFTFVIFSEISAFSRMSSIRGNLKKNSKFKDIVQIGGREVDHPISKK